MPNNSNNSPELTGGFFDIEAPVHMDRWAHYQPSNVTNQVSAESVNQVFGEPPVRVSQEVPQSEDSAFMAWLNQRTEEQARQREVRRQSETSPSLFSGMRRTSHNYSQEDSGLRRQGSVNQPSSRNGFISGNVEVSNNMNIAQIYGQRATYPTIQGHPLIVGTHLAGIEIELEEIRLSDEPTFQYWEAKQDGSLRNSGMEFVCSSPWGGRDLYAASLEIDSFLFRHTPDASWRCSTHVHIDVRDMSVAQVKRMILAYIVYERVLFRCSGWHRYKNNFCVALGFAQEQLSTLANNWHLDDADFTNRVIREWDKYTSLNLLPMSSFGSIEFRISEAKWRKGSIIRLTNRFLSLKELAVNFEGSDSDFIEYLSTLPIHSAIRKGLPKVIQNFEEDLDIGYKLAYEVISMSTLRKLSAYIHSVKSAEHDSSHRANFYIEPRYWEHLRINLETRSNGTWLLENNRPPVLTFRWLSELRWKCEVLGITFDVDWFIFETNQSQRARLFGTFHHQYLDSMAEERREARRAPPAPRRGGDYDMYESAEDDDVEEDGDYESDNDHIA